MTNSQEDVDLSKVPHSRCSYARVIFTGLLGFALPVIAYAEAMNALFGFDRQCRKFAPLFILLPTILWLLVGRDDLLAAAVLLGIQLFIALLVSTVIYLVIRKRGKSA